MKIDGAVFAILGALDAFPRRLAAREISARGGILRHALARRTGIAVLGHRMGLAWPPERIVDRLEAAEAAGARLSSENAFLRLLGLAPEIAGAREISRDALARQSGLDERTLDLMACFDCFDADAEPFSFRDLVAAREYRRIVDGGVGWPALVRAVLTKGRADDGSISEVRLERTGWNSVAMRAGDALTELDGQHLLPLEAHDGDEVDRLFEEADEAEHDREFGRAAALYRRCMELDPGDPTIPFNLSAVLHQLGEWQEARHCLTRVLKLDPAYAEAWYNLAAIAREQKDARAARRYLNKAIAADPGYPDPVYNLALLEFESGDHAEARRLWSAYLDLDPDSEWAEKARHGLQLMSMLADGNADRTALAAGSRGLRPA